MEVAVLNTYFKEHTVTYKISESFTQVDNMLDILNIYYTSLIAHL